MIRNIHSAQRFKTCEESYVLDHVWLCHVNMCSLAPETTDVTRLKMKSDSYPVHKKGSNGSSTVKLPNGKINPVVIEGDVPRALNRVTVIHPLEASVEMYWTTCANASPLGKSRVVAV